jgi:NADH:ubiquinone oxidoreductase subunit 5 (subunit L)/multisubunit Na+/H+ antiporter MnhA subunit
VAARGYRVDDAYAFLIVRPFVGVGRFFWRAVDGSVIDRLLDGIADLVPRAGTLVQRVQSGEVRDYLAAMAVGVILVAALAIGAF